ncbi:MAG: GumC family protein [Chitinophagaceae bacterium]
MKSDSPANLKSLTTNEERSSPLELLFRYLAYLPYFILSVLICMLLGIAYIRYTKPLFLSSTRVFIKSQDDNMIGGSSRSIGQGDLIENALFSNRQVNIDNEIALIAARPLIENVVKKGGFNHSYSLEGNIRTTEIYKSSPFYVEARYWVDSTKYFGFWVSSMDSIGGIIEFKNTSIGPNITFKWDEWIKAGENVIRLRKRAGKLSKDEKIFYEYRPIADEASTILQNLVVNPYGSNTTIILLELKGDNQDKLSDILNFLVTEYNKENINDKNKVLLNTIDFIAQRLELVTKELGDVENNLKDFKTQRNLIDLGSQSNQTLLERQKVEDELSTISIEEIIFNSIKDQVKKSANDYSLIPVNLGFGNSEVNATINNYNELLLKLQRDEEYVGRNSPILADLKRQIKSLYGGLLVSLKNYENTINAKKKVLTSRINLTNRIFGEVPTSEKSLVEIKRQQNVKEGLYLYLLQKREETAVASSSTVSNYYQIEPANGSYVPIEPNNKKIYIFAIIAGLLLPALIIYLIDLFNDKVNSRKDIESRTDIPIIAEIGHMEGEISNLVVAGMSRNVISEQFRILRSNLNFLTQKKKVILVTSTMSGEGKSFVSLNMAAVWALSGKKVALLEFDLRKPRIIKNIGVKRKKEGLSNYLSGQTSELDNLYYELENFPSLHIYGCGPIPPNPAELMIGDRIHEMFRNLDKAYDYIIIDTAPVGLVSDALNLTEFVDATIYVIRQRYSLKKQILFIDEIYKRKQLSHMGLVMNDVVFGGKYGYYGHSYGYGYGYGSSYGEAYGSGGKMKGDYFDQKRSRFSLSRFFGKKK